jgi:hypothetical protein
MKTTRREFILTVASSGLPTIFVFSMPNGDLSIPSATPQSQTGSTITYEDSAHD